MSVGSYTLTYQLTRISNFQEEEEEGYTYTAIRRELLLCDTH